MWIQVLWPYFGRLDSDREVRVTLHMIVCRAQASAYPMKTESVAGDLYLTPDETVGWNRLYNCYFHVFLHQCTDFEKNRKSPTLDIQTPYLALAAKRLHVG